MVIFLNKYANNGRGLRRWKNLIVNLRETLGDHEYSLISDSRTFSKRVHSEFMRGERIFVAAGGDGTVNFLVNHIMQMKQNERKQVILGAIGLGSSNDFHKPFSKDKFFTGKVPFRLNYRSAVLQNVGQVDFEDENHRQRRKYFILNSSIGIIAQANYLFNSEEKVVRWLKSKWVTGTILYTGLKTLFTAPNLQVMVGIKNTIFSTKVTNLSLLISPNVSGNFCYDLDVSPHSDFLGIALCEEMGVLARLKTFFSLTHRKFIGLPKTRIWKTDRVEIDPVVPTALELDGEVYLARKIRINLLKGALKICQ